MTRDEAIQYLGLKDEAELERVVIAHVVDVELEDDGRIVQVLDDMREVLFEEHRKKVGYRPDDPDVVAQTQAQVQDEQEQARQARAAKRGKLEARVKARGK